MNRTLKILFAASLSLVVCTAFSTTVSAGTPNVNLMTVDTVSYKPIVTIPGVLAANTLTNPVAVLKGVYGLAIGVGSVIAVIMIIISGLKYLYEESITGKSDARERIQNAFIGLFVILGSYLLLRTVNPDLVTFDFTLQGGKGAVGQLVATQNALDAVAKLNALAANALGTSLRQADSLIAQADAIKNTTIPGLTAKLNQMEQDGLKAGKTLDQVTNSPEYKAVVDQMQQLDAQEQDLRKQAATVKADAQVAAAKAAQDALNQQTTISVTSGSLGNIQSRLSGYQSSLDTQIAAINSNPSLSADQKAAQIAQAQAQTAANQFLAQAQIKTIQSYDDPAAIAQIKADIAHKYAEITDPKSTVLTDAQKEDLRKQFLTTQQSLNMITQAQNQRDAAAKDQVIKCAVFALVNTGAALNCMK